MKTYYQNTCLGCDLLHSKVCAHYPKNQFPGHYRNVSSPYTKSLHHYTHQYVELRNGIYEGTMTNFKREGLGIFYSDEGFICIGNWFQDFLEGKSIIFFCNGGYLFVDFACNRINGLGVLKMKDGLLISGLWRDNNLEGVAFHHYPDKCLWIECEYKEGQLIRYIREERYGPDQERMKFMGEEKLAKVKIPNMLKGHSELVALIVSVYAENFLVNIIKEMRINVRSQFADFKLISHLCFKKDMNYIGFSENDTPTGLSGLGVLYDDDYNVWLCGHFKGGFLDGLGRINYDNGDVYEGLIRKKELQVGLYYSFKEDSFEFGNFQGNKCVKIFQQGKGFPFELLKKFKHLLHTKHVKFSDKRFDLTTNLQSENFNEIKTQNFSDKLKKVTLSPASFLEEEIQFRDSKSDHLAQNEKNPELELMLSPIPKINDSNEKSSSGKRFGEAFKNDQIFPMNIAQHPLKEEKYGQSFDDFYDKNVHKFTVSSQNNAIKDLTKNQKFSPVRSHINQEVVNLSKPTKKSVHYQPKPTVAFSGTYFFEEQTTNKSLKSLHPPPNENLTKPHHISKNHQQSQSSLEVSQKRSVSLAPNLKRDSDVSDDLRNIFESAYLISLESEKEFQSIPKFDECQQSSKIFPVYKQKNESLRNGKLEKPENFEKRSYLVYTVKKEKTLSQKHEDIVDYLVYDLGKERKDDDINDSDRRKKKKIFGPI